LNASSVPTFLKAGLWLSPKPPKTPIRRWYRALYNFAVFAEVQIDTALNSLLPIVYHDDTASFTINVGTAVIERFDAYESTGIGPQFESF